MSQQENSALNALADLMGLEEERVHEEEETAREAAEAQAARIAAEEKQRAEEEARRQAEEDERLRVEQEEKERLEREERLRIAEAEAEAKAAQEARLKEEQMRLDAQVKIAEKKQKPKWLYALPVVLGGLFISYMVYSNSQADKAAAEQAERDRERDEQFAKLQKQLDDQLAASAQEKERLAKALEAATSEAEREKIRAQQAEQKKKEDDLRSEKKRRSSSKKSKGGSSSAASEPAPEVTKKRRKKIELGGGEDPLGGL